MRLGWLACAVWLTGCSFLFTSSPPARVTPYTTLDCTTSHAAPAIDAVLGVLSAAGTIYEVNEDYPDGYIAAGVGWTLLYSISAIYGSEVVGDCKDAAARRDQLVEQQEQKRQDEERFRREREEWRWRSQGPRAQPLPPQPQPKFVRPELENERPPAQ